MQRRFVFTADARFTVAQPAAAKLPTLSGYALVWNTLSEDRGGYFVRLAPGSARFATPTRALWHHDLKHPLGTTANDTLRITPDDIGVKVEIDLPDTSTGRDVAELVRRGDIAGMSFAMLSPKGKTTTEGGRTIFTAEDYLIDETTVTAAPAFADTTLAIKADEVPPATFADRVCQSLMLQRIRLDLMQLPPCV